MSDNREPKAVLSYINTLEMSCVYSKSIKWLHLLQLYYINLTHLGFQGLGWLLMGVLAINPWNGGYMTYPLPVATAVGVNRLVLQPPISTHKALECPNCYYTMPGQNPPAAAKTGLNLYEGSFLSLWAIRLARKGGRNLVGDTLDGVIPLPIRLKAKIKQWVTPTITYYENRCWDYSYIAKRLSARKPIKLSEYFKKTIINMRVDGTVRRFYEGRVFMGIARFVLLGITCYDVGKYAYRAYKYPQERKKNLKKCLRQAIKWTIGTEIGNIGFDIGASLVPMMNYKVLSGFLMEAVWSASFDLVLQKHIMLDG